MIVISGIIMSHEQFCSKPKYYEQNFVVFIPCTDSEQQS